MGRNLSQVSDPIGSTELASDIGSALVGYTPAGTDAVPTTVQSKLRERVSVFDFMTDAQIASVKNGTLTDVSDAVSSAIAHLFVTDGNTLFSQVEPIILLRL